MNSKNELESGNLNSQDTFEVSDRFYLHINNFAHLLNYCFFTDKNVFCEIKKIEKQVWAACGFLF